MKLIFRGGAQEVGRSCIELQTEGDRYLLDCGVKFTEGGLAYPKGLLDVPHLDGVFLSHAHLDHSGGLPFFEHQDLQGPIFCTSQTRILSKILLKDSYEVARIRHAHPAFERTDLRRVKKDMKMIRFDKRYTHRKITFTYLNAGHIPGSASILIECEGKRLLYTGDLNPRKTLTMIEANPDFGPVDVLITESTYGYRNLPPVEETAEKLLHRIEQVVHRGGRVLLPVFAVGRAQEILAILARRKWDVPVYLDGMAKKVTRSVLVTPSIYVKNKEDLAKMFYNVVKSPKSKIERNEIAQRPGIFITTSGMLQGGPVMHYLKHFWHDKNSAIFMTGYQCKRTNGRTLLDTGFLYMKGWKTKVFCEVERFDFSGHGDRAALEDFLKKSEAKAIVVQHGDPESVEALVAWIKKTMSCPAYGPAIGDEISF